MFEHYPYIRVPSVAPIIWVQNISDILAFYFHEVVPFPAIVIVLCDACGDGEDVGVEDDVAGVEADSVHQQVVGARADAHLAVLVHGLGSLLRIEIVQGVPSG